MNQTLPSLHGGSLETTLTVPLKAAEEPSWETQRFVFMRPHKPLACKNCPITTNDIDLVFKYTNLQK